MSAPEWILPPVSDFDWARPPQQGSADLDVPETHGQHGEHRDHLIHKGLDVVHVVSTIAEIYEYAHILHETAAVADATAGIGVGDVMVGGEVLAAEGGVMAAAAPVLAPLGGVAIAVVTFMELYRAFSTTQRIQTQMGVTYGLMWEVLGVSNSPHETRRDVVAGDVPLTDSERQAWEKGVHEGREMAKKPEVREAIERAIAFEMATQKKDPLTDPHHKAWGVAVDNTLNRVWNEVHEKDVRWGEKGLNNSRLPWTGADGFPTGAPKP